MHRLVRGDVAFMCGRWPLDRARPTLVFIHGAGESSALWTAQVEGLSAHANTVAIDLPGHGRSGGSACDRIPEYAAAVVDFVRAVDAPRPVPCGLSMGGAITQQLLIDAGDRFPAGVIVSSGARLRVLPSLFEQIRTDFPGYVGQIDRLGFSTRTPPGLKAPFLEDALLTRPEVAAGDFAACDRFDVMAQLNRIGVPVLVISAEDDRLTPPKYADYLAAHIPGAVRAHIPAAGHFVPIEKPAEVNAAILRFLTVNRL